MNKIHKHALINGCIRTMDEACSQAEAVLIAGEYIECIGTTAEILAIAGKDARITNLNGKALFPGFIESHSHLSCYSAWSDQVYCGAEVQNLEGALTRLKERAQKTLPGELILGWGFDNSILPEGRGPTRLELDAISTEHPILLIHISVHEVYVNTKALELAGISETSLILGGTVVLDDAGKAQGTLLENAGFQAMLALCPTMTAQNVHKALLSGIAHYNAYGITSVHEAGVGLGGIDSPTYLRVLREMERDGKLNLRLYLSFMTSPFEAYAKMGLATGFGSTMVRFCGPKIYNDGTIQTHTAALSEPYHDNPTIKGDLLIPTEKLEADILRYHSDGYQIAFHGNGDVGIESMISAVEKAQAICPRKDPRHILVHCQTASDSQLERMKKAGIAPSFFGLHVWYYGDRHYDRFLGPRRAERVDPSGSAVRLGMRHSLHADTPVMPPWTLLSIHTAVNRTTRKGRVLGSEQRISATEAVRAYTSHAAWFQFAEHERGSIEPGKLADFVLLSDDLLSIAPEKIADTSVCMTMVGGRIVYEKT